ncbi:MAG: NAD-dependent epimerase/dehydratase family protein [Planctomycetes bacterium]|nr:NAD-dependent epimerase/dehydratase family protein [Planctomycetota bacterium]
MAIALVTGSAGLIGAEAVRFFSSKGFQVIGIDNDMRRRFFGEEASTDPCRRRLERTIPAYMHYDADIRDHVAVESIFARYGRDISIVIHTAAQPSHDWAARDPYCDFSVNATGTLVLLENTRAYAPRATFIFTSTNKVYGDNPNLLPLRELETRWELSEDHPFFEHGIDESMSVDHAKHSLFGVSKLAADAMVQEYGRYFGMNTACFRGGCLTGPGHCGAQLHGFLSYLVKCAVTGQPYTIFGYQGKQVRDNIHAYDLVNMFWHFHQDPRPGEVYNAGGGRHSNCSMLEAIRMCEELTSRKMSVTYFDQNRIGDHVWYISDTRKFQRHYPNWSYTYDLRTTLQEIIEAGVTREATETELKLPAIRESATVSYPNTASSTAV